MSETILSKCPECGVSMQGRDPRKHAIRHWGDLNRKEIRESPEIQKRLKAMGVKV